MKLGEQHPSHKSFLKQCAVIAGTLALLLLSSASVAQAQTFTVLHNFTGGLDGASPYTGLTINRNGDLYGTTAYGGLLVNDCHITNGCGTIFKLARQGSGFIFHPLYQFQGFPSGDGASPQGRVIIGADGALYGTTPAGGDSGQDCGVGCGTVFKLTPPPNFCQSFSCTWKETILYHFTGGTNGAGPLGELAFDGAGNLYGSTFGGGTGGEFGGIVYELTPVGARPSSTTFPRAGPSAE